MTSPHPPTKSVLVSPDRRGGGAGEPAPRPVPSQTETGIALNSQRDPESPFRLGPGGLVVVIVPEQLKAACARRGWSLTQLARRAGISYPTIKSTLRGKAVRPRTAWKLARALDQEHAPQELDHLLVAR